MPHLSILSRNFHLIELGVLELDEIVTQILQRLHPGTSVEQTFILVTPLLKLADILVQGQLRLEEVLLVFFLLVPLDLYFGSP